MSEARARKLSERIQEIVAEALEFKVKDPRLGFVTVTDVRVTADLREATVFYTVLGDEQAQTATAAALASARGMLRTEVGQGTGIKFTPTLEFVADAVPETARHIEDLLEAARESDQEIAARSTGADFAGEPDPYRRVDAEPEDGAVGGAAPAVEG
ncbi:MAG: ribosome-binding factor [Actinomycetota bacterium]|mgnify:CR=1 FL=1|nr:ribosome-binding factor [Actinomycetota bacterium]HQZ84147.1 30S ribosome-binding factor RbfA [Actinomycetota bacterium]